MSAMVGERYTRRSFITPESEGRMNYAEAVKQIAAILDQLPEHEQYRVVQNLVLAGAQASLSSEQTEYARRRERWNQMNRRESRGDPE